MNRDSIIERIKKLLAMTEHAGCTQAEAVQAALLAQKLIADNDVSSSELHGSSDEEPIEHVASEAATRFRNWGKFLAVDVANAFRCKAYNGHTLISRYRQPVFMGRAADARAAALVFDRLYAVGCELGDAERRRVRKEKRREYARQCAPEWWAKDAAADAGARAYESFTWGFRDGVKAELEKQSVALMITTPRDVVDEYESMTFSRRNVNRNVTDDACYGRGEEAGRDAVRAGRVGDGGSRHLLIA